MEMPSLSASTYASQQYPLAALGVAENQIARGLAGAGMWAGNDKEDAQNKLLGAMLQRVHEPIIKKPQQEKQIVSTARIVKVFIADTNDSLPLESRVLYSGEEKLTDLTDQELFFEVPIKELLDAHNAVRLKTQDKKQTEKFGREIFLEAARIRDLKMVVVTVAQF